MTITSINKGKYSLIILIKKWQNISTDTQNTLNSTGTEAQTSHKQNTAELEF